MTFRAPLISRPARKPDSTIARTFVSAGLALLTAVALPVGKSADRDHPNQKRNHYENLSWIETNDLPRQLAVKLPKQITDWPLPRRLKVINRDGHLQNVAPLHTVVVTTAPFRQTEWPLPRKGKLDLPDTTFTESLSLSAQPFAQFGWTLPVRFRTGPPDAAFVNGLPIVVGIPFAQFDWALAERVRLDAPDTAFVNLLPLHPVGPPTPAAQIGGGYIKWTKPHRKRDAHAEILAIVRQVAAGPHPLGPVVAETIAAQVAEQIRPTIDTGALVTQITAAAAHYAQMDEEDTETLLTGLL